MSPQTAFDADFRSMAILPRIHNPYHHELLPSEIWMYIIDHCTKASQRTCLSLSRTFHSRTIPALFREIIVCFSAWESWLSGMSDDELDETRSSRAFGVLRRITLDASFASVVRVLEIEAYMQNGSGGVFENCCLIEAIQCLPNLERFLWMGCSPLPSLGVVDALAASCPRLRGLMLPIFAFAKLPFHKLKSVRSIDFHWTIEEISDPLLDDYLDVHVNIGEETFPDLRELYFFFPTPASVSSLGSLLQQITHLSLLFLRDLGHLEVVLQNLPHVQSLTLQASRDTQEEQLFAAFKHGPFNFPRLTQLAIVGEEREVALPLPATRVSLLAQLVRGMPTLRCFDCSICIASTDLELLSPALKQLRVLGLHVAPGDPTGGSFSGAVRHIPAELDALALFVSSGAINHEREWAELWMRCQRLRFFYFRACDDVAGDAEVTLKRFAEAGKSLRLVGLQRAVHNVERDSKDGSVRLSKKWSERKVEYRGVGDFDCPEWDWLTLG